MKYNEQLASAAEWLNGIRNPDGGWGLKPKLTSSIANTAEALYVLNKANRRPIDIEVSISFLKKYALVEHPLSRGPNLRYFAFGIFGLLNAGIDITDSTVQYCADSIRKMQLNFSGWSISQNDSSIRVFPSFLALWTLQMVEVNCLHEETLKGLEWLMSIQKKDGGWGFTEAADESSNSVCTAYALIALSRQYEGDPRLQSGLAWLVRNSSEWLKNPLIIESTGIADWHHCTPVWASLALVNLGVSVMSPIIRGTIAYFSKLFDYETGTWRQSLQGETNVRSSFWPVLALERIKEFLDLNDIAMEYQDSRQLGISLP